MNHKSYGRNRVRGFLLAVIVLSAAGLAACAGANGPAGGGAGNAANGAASIIPALQTDVNAENMAGYDFTEQAMVYLEYIGTELRDRSCTERDSSHDAAREWIKSELSKAGYADTQIEEQSFQSGSARGVNIILTVEGEDPSRQIIVGGHYDGDGVGDNGSGTALLLATAAGLAGQKPHYTVKYIFFDCEEIGMVGSSYYAKEMTDEEAKSTIYMINMDSLAFGDYCNIYGGDPAAIGLEDAAAGRPMTEGYAFAADAAEQIGFSVMRTEDLEGYYAAHGTGPAVEDGTFYTNPWTREKPSPSNFSVPSPATLPASDHVGFMERGIVYIYFEATNWFAEGENDDVEGTSYTGYIETYDSSVGEHGMFMNTEYDTWENLNRYFPGRAEQHYHLYSPLLSALILVR